MTDTPTPQVDFATGQVLTVSIPTGTYRTYVMQWQVSNSRTGEIISRQDGVTIHDWLQTVTDEQLQAVGDQFVSRAAMWAAGVR